MFGLPCRAYNNRIDTSRLEKYLKPDRDGQATRRMLKHHFETHDMIEPDHQEPDVGFKSE